jgi:23S rRNA pseudouridine1911/1915/1917 synthase
MELEVLHEDNHLLVVTKPAGLLVQSDRSGDVCLTDVAKEYLKTRYAKPGNVYLGLVHRLDRNVSGVVLLARTSKAAARLSSQFRDKTVRKIYWAVCEAVPRLAEGELTAWLAKDGDAHGVTRAQNEPFPDGRECLLRYRVLEARGERALVEVEPVTGRRHQIRAQLGLIGCPLVGDVKYGAGKGLPDHRIGLHASELHVDHPVGKERLVFRSEPPADWPWPRNTRK